jgi:hypothetical protein
LAIGVEFFTDFLGEGFTTFFGYLEKILALGFVAFVTDDRLVFSDPTEIGSWATSPSEP